MIVDVKTISISKTPGRTFGFTLRHLLVNPENNIPSASRNHAMETVYVQDVRCGSLAEQAGLKRGHPLLQVNNLDASNASFQVILSEIKNSTQSIHLTVGSKESDHIQMVCAKMARDGKLYKL